MPSQPLTRRAFCSTAAATLLLRTSLLTAQGPLHPSARPDVAAIDHDRILAAADRALAIKPVPITALPSPRTPGTPRDFFSEAADFLPPKDDTIGKKPYVRQPGEVNPDAFVAHRDAVFSLSRMVSALAAAYQITHDQRYATQAVAHLKAWFIDPTTSMLPTLHFGAMIPNDPKSRPEGVLETVFFAEIAQAIPALSTSDALTPDDLTSLKGWFAAYLQWLNESRLAGLARDQKDHHASSWLLQAATYARLTSNEPALAALRQRFKTVTLRAQIIADGTFPHELLTPFPYRNSLFNLDMLTASCELLSTRFESLWEFELQDGPGMHIVMARHFPYIQHRETWPYRADLTHFTDLPVRNPALLFAARAYTRPEYAELWKTLNPDPAIPELARTFPISQPLLWINRPRP